MNSSSIGTSSRRNHGTSSPRPSHPGKALTPPPSHLKLEAPADRPFIIGLSQGIVDHHADVDATVYELVAFEQGGQVNKVIGR